MTETLYDVKTGAQLLTVAEAARFMDYHPFSLYRLVFQGKIGYRRLGPKTILFSREDLERYRATLQDLKPRRGKPLPPAETWATPLQAAVEIRLGGKAPVRESSSGEGKKWRQFRWEQLPMIRARMDARYGRRLTGMRISVRSREGGAWSLVYAAPRGPGRSVRLRSEGGK